jgi:predicted HTH domain antitoxin
MRTLTLDIPEAVLAAVKIPRTRLKVDLKRELALQLYREHMISFANAHRMADMSKMEFHHLLGERQIPRQYDEEDYDKDMENIAQWKAAQ